MSKKTSFGVLIVNEHDQVLLAHVTGQDRWDIPKGGGTPSESPLEAALRETFEETGVVLRPDRLKDLGVIPYGRHKDLHLFRTRVSTQEVDVSQCRCTSYFTHFSSGQRLPEMDGFRWAGVADIPRLCTPRMAGLLSDLLARVPA